MSSYLVRIGANRSIVIRAFSAEHACDRVENRLLKKSDRVTPVLAHLTRELSEIEVQRLKISKRIDLLVASTENLLEEVGGAAW